MALGKAALSFSGFLYKMEVRFATSIVYLSGMLLFILGGRKEPFFSKIPYLGSLL